MAKRWRVKNGQGCSPPHAGRATLRRSCGHRGAPTFLSASPCRPGPRRQKCRRSTVAAAPPERRPTGVRRRAAPGHLCVLGVLLRPTSVFGFKTVGADVRRLGNARKPSLLTSAPTVLKEPRAMVGLVVVAIRNGQVPGMVMVPRTAPQPPLRPPAPPSAWPPQWRHGRNSKSFRRRVRGAGSGDPAYNGTAAGRPGALAGARTFLSAWRWRGDTQADRNVRAPDGPDTPKKISARGARREKD